MLTIIQAWRRAGSPRAQADSIVTYSGAWSDYCRYPLMWLGHPDPAKALLEQVRHDPDGDALSGLMQEWHAVFGTTPTTVRKAVESGEKLPQSARCDEGVSGGGTRRDQPFKAGLAIEEECRPDHRGI